MTDEPWQLYISEKQSRKKCTKKNTPHIMMLMCQKTLLCVTPVFDCAEKHLHVCAERQILIPAWCFNTSFSAFTWFPGSSSGDCCKSSIDKVVTIKSGCLVLPTMGVLGDHNPPAPSTMVHSSLCILCYMWFLSCSFLAGSPQLLHRKHKSLSEDKAGEVP